MGSVGTDESTREALLDMQRYLADEIAPMMVQDAVKKLLRLPPDYGATVVHHWIEAQLSAPNRAVTVSNYVYHAAKKIHVLSEMGLVDTAAMQAYLGQLCNRLVKLCPEREQTELRLRLSRIGETEVKLAAPVRLLNREAGSAQEEGRIQQILEQRAAGDTAPDAGPPVVLSPRVSMLMERLGTTGGKEAEGPTDELLASLVSRAAIDSANSREFESSLDGVRKMGIEPELNRVLRELGNRLPGWDVDLTQLGGPKQQKSMGHLLTAMHRIVALAESPEQSVDRFNSVVYAAVEQFNDGHLAQAVAMFEVARSLIEEKKVDGETAKVVVQRVGSSVSLSALRRFASTPAKHGLLRKVLRFFPCFSPSALLERLDGEQKRELRKLMLSLIEVTGPPCRPELVNRLGRYLSGELLDPESYYSRNAIFLLRRIPRGSDENQEYELELLIEYSKPECRFMVTKEAVGALALITLPRAEAVLIDRLEAFENGALDDTLDYDAEETLEILDRTCAALTRLGTPQALQAVVRHGFRKEPGLGDTLLHLHHLGARNLDVVPGEMKRLTEALRKMLPARLLGVVVGRRKHEAAHLIQALSGTPEPAVLRLFEEIAERFPDEDFAEQARAALARSRGKAAPGADAPHELAGDLEIFGLPTLLQSISGSEMTGRLVFSDKSGRERAVMLMERGKIRQCRFGRLRGMDAACQLFERPQSGSFRFTAGKPGEGGVAPGGEELEVMSVILEACRRHDEFQQDRALVPDGSSLMPGEAVPPSLPEEEKDTQFAKALWSEAKKGTAPESCEGILGDAYRIRRLYLHWLESGALALRPAV